MSARSSGSPRVLVTGAGGFVGGALVRTLSAGGVTIPVAAHRSLPETTPAGSEVAAVGDIGPQTDWRPALAGCDIVVHCAARAHVLRETSAEPLAAFRQVNVAGTVRLASQAMEAGVRRFVFISSAGVHGPFGDAPFRESDIPSPTEAYAISKLEAERELLAMTSGSAMSVTVLRPPLIYGPGVKGNMLSLLKWVAAGRPVPLGSVTGQRSFIGLQNLCDAIIATMTRPDAGGKTYLVSDQADMSTQDLVRLMAKALNRSPRLLPVPAPALRLAGWLSGRSRAIDRLVGSLTVDSSLITSELGWRPSVPPAIEVQRMVEALRARRAP